MLLKRSSGERARLAGRLKHRRAAASMDSFETIVIA
jgi:hypothetical protein